VSYLEARGRSIFPAAPCECLNAARSLFERFHSFMPPQVTRSACRRVIPPVLMRVGELCGLIYRSDRGQCGSPRTFIHFMEAPPVLACDPDGKQLYVVGGRYRVTRKGIEG
jgi:hypothetical protein